MIISISRAEGAGLLFVSITEEDGRAELSLLLAKGAVLVRAIRSLLLLTIREVTEPMSQLEHNRRYLFAKAKFVPDKTWRDFQGWRHHLRKKLNIDPRHFHGLLHSDDVENHWERHLKLRKTWWHWKQHTAVKRGNATRRRMKRVAAKAEGRTLPHRKIKRPVGRPRKTWWTVTVEE